MTQLHGPRCVLVGDAGHSVSSNLGQGCNAALESARVLGEVVDLVGGDPDKVPAAYNKARIQDVHALQHLEHFCVSDVNLQMIVA